MAAALAGRAQASTFRVFTLGVVAGVVFFCGTLYWISQVMAAHGGIPTIVAALLTFGLACHLGLFVGLFSWLVAVATRRFGLAGVWLAPALWVASEWLRAWLGWNFPWAILGASQATVLPVVQLASVTGVYGLSALLALISTAAAVLALSNRPAARRGVVAAGLALAAVVAWGSWRLNANVLATSGTPIRVGLLQGNIPQDQKWDATYRAAILDRYISLSRQAVGAGAQLVLWPEASTPFYFDLDAVNAEPIRRLAAESRTPFLIGTDQFESARDGRGDRYFNAAVLVGPDGRTRASYRKMRLVPFGEYVPFQQVLFFVGPLVEAVSDFSAGDDPTVFDVEGTRFSVAICYEAVYGSMAREFVSRGSQLLTTITNDAWFGRSSAAYQHFQQAALRSVEQGRYLVRAANTGISGAVDPYGRVLAQTPLFEPASLTVDVRLLAGRTVYGTVGDVVAWVALVVAGFVALQARRRPADRRAASQTGIMTP